MNLTGDSPNAATSAVKGTNTGTPKVGVEGSAVGVEGDSSAGWGSMATVKPAGAL